MAICKKFKGLIKINNSILFKLHLGMVFPLEHDILKTKLKHV